MIKRGILNVVSEVAVIPDKNIMGTIAAELVAIITRGMDKRDLDPDLLDQYVQTCGVIIKHLEDFVLQIEILQNMIDALMNVTNVSPLLLAINHSFSFFTLERDNESNIVASVVVPLLQVSSTTYVQHWAYITNYTLCL